MCFVGYAVSGIGSSFIAGSCFSAIVFAKLLKPHDEDIEGDRVTACVRTLIDTALETPSETKASH